MAKPQVSQGRRLIEHAELLRLVSYDPNSGAFVRLVNTGPRGCHKAGAVLGHDNGSGYLKFSVEGSEYYAHRLAWFYVHAVWPFDHIDHINGCRHDNRISNLRDVAERVNHQNLLRATAKSTTGVLGVSYSSRRNKYSVHIQGTDSAGAVKRRHLRCASLEQARSAYAALKRELHPEVAV